MMTPNTHAQRRPGHAPRRHGLFRPADLAVTRQRSTKAGARTPATRGRCRAVPSASSAAQRRPGHAPRRHPSARTHVGALSPAQRRPGHAPRRHPAHDFVRRPAAPRSTKAGARTSATPKARFPEPGIARYAQRRPGHAPRRHSRLARRRRHRTPRSTKAGARTPATRLPLYGRPYLPPPAQRRPGHAPRRHFNQADKAGQNMTPLNEGRGTHPGDTRRDHRRGDAADRRRSTKAGARTPATPALLAALHGAEARRSTKAGARTPATRTRAVAQGIQGERSTKAGARTPATHERVPGFDAHRLRSTKAGARTPATPRPPAGACRSSRPLNEGRGTHPGDTCTHFSTAPAACRAQRRPATPRGVCRAAAVCSSLNEGRGTHPGDTHPITQAAAPVSDPRSTKAGARTPATRCCTCRPRREPPSLNEGRGTHPGDTLHRSRPPCAPWPLNEGRGTHPGDTRHHRAGGDVQQLRSTKAGARTPATPASADRMRSHGAHAQRRPGHAPRRHAPRALSSSSLYGAQRRPGHAPRRHMDPRHVTSVGHLRSTKAGARTPATRSASGHPLGSAPRSTKAGARTPATLRPAPSRIRTLMPRSTKAGARTPATRFGSGSGTAARSALNEGRGTHPGDTRRRRVSRPRRVLAQRRPGHAPRRHRNGKRTVGLAFDRSTKAGARTPATLTSRSKSLLRAESLNEGRGTHPGDTARRRCAPCGARLAQRRPGHAPRRHVGGLRGVDTRGPAQRRPGHAPRRHPREGASPTACMGPLNEGRGTHPGDTSSPSARGQRPISAQRRPGHAPRRHLRRREVNRPIVLRSTKAGARTPATPGYAEPWRRCRASLNEGRGTHPGDTRTVRRGGRVGARSTKAGARTPATLMPPMATAASMPTLNEGRGTHPGDTRASVCALEAHAPLNEGRGTHPGDTSTPPLTRAPGLSTLNEGRGTHPGDT